LCSNTFNLGKARQGYLLVTTNSSCTAKGHKLTIYAMPTFVVDPFLLHPHRCQQSL